VPVLRKGGSDLRVSKLVLGLIASAFMEIRKKKMFAVCYAK